jgi:hypothetical protein
VPDAEVGLPRGLVFFSCGEAPDHSGVPKNDHGRFRQGDNLRYIFETVAELCLSQELVGAEGFAVDADAGQNREALKRSGR